MKHENLNSVIRVSVGMVLGMALGLLLTLAGGVV